LSNDTPGDKPPPLEPITPAEPGSPTAEGIEAATSSAGAPAQPIEGEAYLSIVWRQFCRNKPALISLYLMAPLFLIAIFAPVMASSIPFVFYDGHLIQLSTFHRAIWKIREEGGAQLVEVQLQGMGPGVKTGDETKISSATGGDFKLVREQSGPESAESRRYVSSDAKLIAALQKVDKIALQFTVEIEGKLQTADVGRTIYPWLRHTFNPAESIDYLFNMAMFAFAPWLVLSVGGFFYLGARGMPTRTRLLWSGAAFLLLTVALCLFFYIPGMRPDNRYATRSFPQEDFESELRWGVYALLPFSPRGDNDPPSNKKDPFYRKPPSEAVDINDAYTHWLGTDDTGTDVLAQMLYGTRLSISVGFVAVSIYISIGIVVGAVAGYFGGVVDMLISRVIEIVLLFPVFFLILTLVALIGRSIFVVMFVIGVTGWPRIARLIRGEVLKQRAIDYTSAARALGASHARIIFRHILPNSLSPALVSAPFGIASAIVLEASLSLLGFGVEPPTPSWGTLLRHAFSNYSLWWLIVFPSLAIFFAVTVFNLVGSGLRDAMDPRLRV